MPKETHRDAAMLKGMSHRTWASWGRQLVISKATLHLYLRVCLQLVHFHLKRWRDACPLAAWSGELVELAEAGEEDAGRPI